MASFWVGQSRAPILALVAGAGLCGFLGATGLSADPLLCPKPEMSLGPDITVNAPDPGLAERICAVSRAAIAELAACNVVIDEPVEIKINNDLVPGCVGQYHCGEGLIEILSPSELARRNLHRSAFSRLDEEAYFDSIITHELTHVAYDGVFCPFGSCPTTAEFLAYTMQVRSLSETNRALFLEGTPGTRVTTPADLALVLMMAPDKFAQLAWEFFSRPEKGCDYIGEVMSGDILLDLYLP